MSVWGAIAQAVMDIGKDIFNVGENRRANRVAYDRQRALLHEQANINRENWAMQNAYNTPAAQMGRYRAAGLNPNLIYNQSNTSGAISSSSAPSVTSHVGKFEKGLNIMNLINEFRQAKLNRDMTAANIEYTKASSSKAEAEAENAKTLGEKYKYDVDLAKIIRDFKKQTFGFDVAMKEWAVENAEKQYELSESQRQLNFARSRYSTKQARYLDQMIFSRQMENYKDNWFIQNGMHKLKMDAARMSLEEMAAGIALKGAQAFETRKRAEEIMERVFNYRLYGAPSFSALDSARMDEALSGASLKSELAKLHRHNREFHETFGTTNVPSDLIPLVMKMNGDTRWKSFRDWNSENRAFRGLWNTLGVGRFIPHTSEKYVYNYMDY